MISAKTCHQSQNFLLMTHPFSLLFTAKQLNDDLQKISEWAFQWKVAFNPDLSKQAQEIVFSLKTHKISHPKVNYNNSPIVQSTYQKHLGLI